MRQKQMEKLVDIQLYVIATDVNSPWLLPVVNTARIINLQLGWPFYP